MDIERTMAFILDRQAKAEVQMAAMREQQAKTNAQIAAILRQQAKAEGQMAAIRKLIQAGMTLIVKQGERVNELAEAQKLTEIKLQGLIDALRRGGNGSRAKR